MHREGKANSAMMRMAFFLALSLCLLGEPSSVLAKWVRFYPGPLLPPRDVAFLMSNQDCQLNRIFTIAPYEGFFARRISGGEFKPGKYSFCIFYSWGGFESKECSEVKAELLPGHVYLAAAITEPNGNDKNFLPVIYDITPAGARVLVEQAINLKPGDLEKRMAEVDEYFTGGRTPFEKAEQIVVAMEEAGRQDQKIKGAWGTIKKGCILQIIAKGISQIVEVEDVDAETIRYHEIDGVSSFFLKKEEIQTLRVLAGSLAEYEKNR